MSEVQVIETSPKVVLAECPPEQKTPLVQPASQMGTPPETQSFLEKVRELVFVVAIGLLTISLLVALLPFFLVMTAVRRIWAYFYCSKYHTPPSSVKIAVVGGGWTGIGIIQKLRELGVQDITGFEKNDDLGGTFHPNLRYHSLQIHGAMWATSFENYRYSPGNEDVMDGKVLGAEGQAYIKRFAKDREIFPFYEFNSNVTSVQYDSANRKATLVVEDAGSGTTSQKGPFDFVIYASQASQPKMITIPGQEDFEGTILHSQSFKTTQFQEILSKKAKVVVIGGSKTGSDLAICFQRAGYEAFNWVFRKPYLFFKYEYFFHDRSVIKTLGGFVTTLGLLLSLISPSLGGWIFWYSGLATTFGRTPHNDWRRFHWGILCPNQRSDLAKIPDTKRHESSPKRLTANALELDNGEILPADYVLLGTGCRSGVEKLRFEKDGTEFEFNQETQPMLNHFLIPEFPVFADATAFWTTFGPLRGANSAMMAVYHLCVRPTMTEDEMVAMASKQLLNSRNVEWLFQSRVNPPATWLKMHINLLASGITEIFTLIYHVLELHCLGNMSVLPLDILPKTPHASSKKND